MSVGIILPTIPGREDMYDLVLRAYKQGLHGYEAEIVTPIHYPTVAQAWNAGAAALTGDHDFLHFGIDDNEPQEGWLEAAIDTCHEGYLPAAHQTYPDGTHDCCGSLGFAASLGPEAADWTMCRSSGIIFTKKSWWDEVGEFHGPLHYYCDDDWFWRAAILGIPVVYRRPYAFVHHHLLDQIVNTKGDDHKREFIAHATRLGPVKTALRETA